MTAAVSAPPPSGAMRTAPALAAAGLSFGAALVHGSVIAAHFREYWLLGLFFAIVTPLQVLWAETVRRHPTGRQRLLAVGATGNLAIAGTWMISRVIGLPFGPERFEPEAVGVKDVLATLDELSIAALVAMLLLRRRTRPTPVWSVAGALRTRRCPVA